MDANSCIVNVSNFPEPNLPRILPKKDIKTLWLPLVVYTNTDQQETTRLRVDWEWSTKVVANRESNFERSGYEMLDEIEIKNRQISESEKMKGDVDILLNCPIPTFLKSLVHSAVSQ